MKTPKPIYVVQAKDSGAIWPTWSASTRRGAVSMLQEANYVLSEFRIIKYIPAKKASGK